jgi:hypothetical protein
MWYVLGRDWDYEVVLFSCESKELALQCMDAYEGELPVVEVVHSSECSLQAW